MQGTIQNYTLDMADGTAPKPLIVKQGDTNSRQARISLKAFNQPWTIPFGCQIQINVRKKDGTYANATCTMENEHTVLVPITEQMTVVSGTHLGELFFLGHDGDIRSQTFPLVVWDAVSDLDRMVSSDDYQALKDALRQVQISTDAADIAAQYATEHGNSARDAAQRANDAADSIQVAVNAAAAAKTSETNAKASETSAVRAQQEVTDYVEAQKAAFVGYSKRETDSKYANALTETATGEGSVTVEDAWTAPVLGLEVVGKSEQVVTTGAQLIPYPYVSGEGTHEGITAKTTNGHISISGTTSTGTNYNIYSIPPGEYAVKIKGIHSGMHLKVHDPKVSETLVLIKSSQDKAEVVSNAFVVPEDHLATLYFNQGSANIPVNIDVDIMLTESSKINTSYEPYTGGAPSPSPDYPQGIISVGTVSTGAQLWKLNDNINKHDCTYTVSDSQEITMVVTGADPYLGGVTTKGMPYESTSGFLVMIYDNEKYCLNSTNSDFTKNYVTFFDDNKNSLGYVSASGGGILTPPAGSMYATVRVGLANGVGITGQTYKTKVMFKNIKSTVDWEPYTGGKPSPSVEYPAKLEVGVTGAQLFDASRLSSKTAGGATVTNNGDGSFTIAGSGELSAGFSAYYSLTHEESQHFFPAGKYSIATKSTPYLYVNFKNATGTLASLSYISGTKEITEALVNDDGYYVNIGFTGNIGQSITPVTIWPMLNAGSTALPWEPYAGYQNASITLTEPLHGIGEYRYRIMCRDGVWGIERRVGAVDNGQWKKINVTSESAGHRFVYDATDMIKKLNCMVMCTKYTRRPNGSSFSNAGNYVATDERGKIFIRTLNPDFETIEAFKEFMADAITLYPLAAPTWEPLPSATQQALNELTTYAGTTHLTITAGGLTPDVTLDYVQDTHKALERCQEAAREYTDNQIAAIVAALPTATQAAIVDNQTTKLLQEV